MVEPPLTPSPRPRQVAIKKLSIVAASLTAVAAVGWLVWPSAPRAPNAASVQTPTPARDRLSRVCEQGSSAEDERQCLVQRAALGRYQEIIDAVESSMVAPEPYQEYFIGVAYFALSNRTNAASLRCFRSGRARAHFENFLNQQRTTFNDTLGFGTADEMKYTYIAARALQSIGAAKGCEAPGESLVSLERYGKKYLADRIESLFFNFGTPGAEDNPLTQAFEGGLGQVQKIASGFVGSASRLETNYGLIRAEIDSGWRVLGVVFDTANGWEKESLVKVQDPASGALTYGLGPGIDQLKANIEKKRAEYAELSASGGALGAAKATIDARIKHNGITGMEDYAAKRDEARRTAHSLLTDLVGVTDTATALLTMKSAEALRRPPVEAPTSVQALWAEIEKQWRHEKPGCKVNPTKWFCK